MTDSELLEQVIVADGTAKLRQNGRSQDFEIKDLPPHVIDDTRQLRIATAREFFPIRSTSIGDAWDSWRSSKDPPSETWRPTRSLLSCGRAILLSS